MGDAKPEPQSESSSLDEMLARSNMLNTEPTVSGERPSPLDDMLARTNALNAGTPATGGQPSVAGIMEGPGELFASEEERNAKSLRGSMEYWAKYADATRTREQMRLAKEAAQTEAEYKYRGASAATKVLLGITGLSKGPTKEVTGLEEMAITDATELGALAVESGAGVLGTLAGILDAGSKYLIRAPLWYAGMKMQEWIGNKALQQNPPTWEEAKEMASFGWAADWKEYGLLGTAGQTDEERSTGFTGALNWFGGMLAEIVSDPLLVTGFGLGKVYKPATEIQKLGVAVGSPIAGTPARLGFYIRPFWKKGTTLVSPRVGIGMPGTGPVAALIEKGQRGIAKVFRPAEEAPNLLGVIQKVYGDPAKAEATYTLLRQMGDNADNLVKLKLTPEQMQRAVIAAEHFPGAAQGEAFNINGMYRVLGPRRIAEKEYTAAGLVSDMYEKQGRIIYGDLKLPYSQLDEGLKASEAQLGKEIGQVEEKAMGYVAQAEKGMRQVTEGQRLLDSIEARATKVSETLGGIVERRVGNLESQARGWGARAQRAEGNMTAGLTEKGEKYWTASYKARVQAYKAELRKDTELAERLHGIADVNSRNALYTWNSGTDYLYSHEITDDIAALVPEKVGSFEATLDAAQEAHNQAARLNDAMRNMTMMNPTEFDQILRQTLPLAEYGKAKMGLGEVKALQFAQAKVQRRLDALQRAVDGKLSAADAVVESKRFEDLIGRAEILDAERSIIPAYVPHLKQPEIQVAEGLKVRPSPLGLSGRAQPRQFKQPSGRPSYFTEIQEEFKQRLSAGDPYKAFSENPKWGRWLREMYQTDDLGKAITQAKEGVAAGEDILARFYKMDPAEMFAQTVMDVANDTRKVAMSEGIIKIASPFPQDVTDVKLASLGEGIPKQYRNHWIPKEVADDLYTWTKALDSANRDPRAYESLYDTALGIWKMTATGVSGAAYHVRNAVDDMARAFSHGPFNPIAMHVDGVKSLSGKGMIDLGGTLGVTTAKDAGYLATAYGVDDSFLQEGFRGTPRKMVGYLALPERVRRRGYFFQRIQQGMTPMEAARDTKAVFFDYSALAPWEKEGARRILPFWSWRRKNMAFQVDTLFSNPWWTNAAMKLMGENGQPKPNQEPEWVPEYMRNQMHFVMNEGGVTSIMSGLGLSVGDLMEVLDLYGNPKGAFEKVIQTLEFEVAPPIKTGISLVKGELSNARVRAPEGVEGLPESIRSFMNIKQEPFELRGKPVMTWTMPSWSKNTLRQIGLWNTALKAMRTEPPSDAFKKHSLSKWTTLLTSLDVTRYSEDEVQVGLIRERLNALEGQAKSQGMIQGNEADLTPEGVQSDLGNEILYWRKEWSKVNYRARLEEEYRRSPEVQ